MLGRIGVLRVGGKVLETPCLLPVVHPVSQAVSTGELKAMGFGALMTNSYIIRTRKKAEVLKVGIHGMLDFDGVLMTDSGGYQVLEYGDIGVDYRDVASFQADIGSDIAVTLDRPTGYPQSRGVAEESVRYSLKNASATLREYGREETIWVGPIQGGLFQDLVSQSAKSLCGAGFEFLALGSPVQVMENYMFADLVRMIVAARKPIPYSMPLHLFGAGHPLTMALAVALGCDTFDSASYILFARNGRYMNRDGVLSLDIMKYLPCSCAVCSRTSAKELREMDEVERVRRIAIHNLNILRENVEACKEAIVEGRLWDLVEETSMSHPRLREAFRELSLHTRLLSEGTPLLKGRGLMIRSEEDLRRPELLLAQDRLSKVLKARLRRMRNKKGALLSKWDSVPVGKLGPRDGNRAVESSRGVDVYRLHPALGVYPAELDFVYPFTQIVATAPIGGVKPENRAKQRDNEAAAVVVAVSELRKLGYASVKLEKDVNAKSVNKESKKKDGNERKKVKSEQQVRSRRTRRDASPSPRSTSVRPRSPRRL